MEIKDELKKLMGKPCWFNEGILEIRKNSDAEIVGIEGDNLVIKNVILGHVNKIPFHAIDKIRRKDQIRVEQCDMLLMEGAKEGDIKA